MDGILRNLLQKTRTLSLAKIKSVEETDLGLECVMTLIPSEDEVVAEAMSCLAGSGGGILRKPKEGEIGVVALIDAELTNAIVIGWLYHGDLDFPADLKEGYYIISPKEEDLELKTDQAGIKLSHDGNLEIQGEKTTIKLSNDGTIDIKGENTTLKLSSDGTIDLKGHQGTLQFANSGTIQIKNQAGGLKISPTGGVQLGNDRAELVALLENLLNSLTAFASAATAGATAVPPEAVLASSATALNASLAALTPLVLNLK